MAKNNNRSKIKTQVLLWPVTDGSMEFDSYEEYGEQRFLTSSLMEYIHPTKTVVMFSAAMLKKFL